MCLTVDDNITEKKALQFARNGTEKIKVYKVFKVNKEEVSIRGNYMSNYFYESGWNVAEGSTPNMYTTNYILGGVFHAWTKESCACCPENNVIIQCEVNVEDIVAYGNSNDIVFRKMFIPPKTLDKIFPPKYEIHFKRKKRELKRAANEIKLNQRRACILIYNNAIDITSVFVSRGTYKPRNHAVICNPELLKKIRVMIDNNENFEVRKQIAKELISTSKNAAIRDLAKVCYKAKTLIQYTYNVDLEESKFGSDELTSWQNDGLYVHNKIWNNKPLTNS
jgi:hypothetical protein